MSELPDDRAELVWRDWRDRHGITIQLPVQDPREFRGAFIDGHQAGYAAGVADEAARAAERITALENALHAYLPDHPLLDAEP